MAVFDCTIMAKEEVKIYQYRSVLYCGWLGNG